jgi:hypothetical protein
MSKGDRLRQWVDMIKYPDHKHEGIHNLSENPIKNWKKESFILYCISFHVSFVKFYRYLSTTYTFYVKFSSVSRFYFYFFSYLRYFKCRLIGREGSFLVYRVPYTYHTFYYRLKRIQIFFTRCFFENLSFFFLSLQLSINLTHNYQSLSYILSCS